MVSDAKKKANKKYASSHLKRVPLDIQIETYEEWKSFSESLGKPLNTVIREAMADKIKSRKEGE